MAGGLAATGLVALGVWVAVAGPLCGAEPGERTVMSVGSTASPSASASGSVSADAETARSWQRCGEEIRAAAEAVDAGRMAATYWRQHVGAQQKFDRGEITSEQAKAIWKESKIPGPADLTRFSVAKGTYDREQGACRLLHAAPPAGSAGRQGGPASACAARSELLGTAVAAAALVVGAWADHQDMMAHQDHSQVAYPKRWAGMVKAAPMDLDALDGAATRVERAEPCEIPTA